MVIGITGCPGSGKTVLANVIASQGWVMVDVDDIGRAVVEDEPKTLEKLVEAFGRDIIDSEGKFNRHLVARRAFAKPEKTQILNDIVHPALIDRVKSRINVLRYEKKNTVVNCALIFEWGIENLFDVIVCVQAQEHIRKERLIQRDGRSPEEIEGIFSAQLPENEKVSRADIVITNNSSMDKIKTYGLIFSELPRYFGEM